MSERSQRHLSEPPTRFATDDDFDSSRETDEFERIVG